ncbi:MAG: 3-phosphoshikimate 1-carboxyvinyltransferase [Ignavibacteriae bacterium]|nr:MAG: 3-phosphoshikimate 1-carboxyvinyltransferase [Ignavibacteriota bacterium]
MIKEFNQISKVKGTLKLPGDKSISHRAVMFAGLADGKSEITNYLMSEDVLSTINAFRELGCKVNEDSNKIKITGRGINGLTKPEQNLYLGNSGTTTRLLSGILSAQNFPTVLTGDASLSKRPMERIITPLSLMGAKIESKNGFLPLKIFPNNKLKSIEYKLPIASAQIKSAVLLAGLFLDDETCVIETKKSRNHTEKMLNLKIEEKDGARKIYSSKKNFPKPDKYIIPSDISTAAFFIVLTLLVKDSELILPNVSLNESRTGILKVLKEMGANFEYDNVKEINGEARGTLIVKSSKLKNISITSEIIPNIIDEIPILAIAGIFAEGDFIIRNAKELRVKESDRIKSVCKNLKLLNLNVMEFEDGFQISGSPNNVKATFESFDDHRIAMTFTILSFLLEQGGTVKQFECVNISNPNFLEQVKQITRI